MLDKSASNFHPETDKLYLHQGTIYKEENYKGIWGTFGRAVKIWFGTKFLGKNYNLKDVVTTISAGKQISEESKPILLTKLQGKISKYNTKRENTPDKQITEIAAKSFPSSFAPQRTMLSQKSGIQSWEEQEKAFKEEIAANPTSINKLITNSRQHLELLREIVRKNTDLLSSIDAEKLSTIDPKVNQYRELLQFLAKQPETTLTIKSIKPEFLETQQETEEKRRKGSQTAFQGILLWCVIQTQGKCIKDIAPSDHITEKEYVVLAKAAVEKNPDLLGDIQGNISQDSHKEIYLHALALHPSRSQKIAEMALKKVIQFSRAEIQQVFTSALERNRMALQHFTVSEVGKELFLEKARSNMNIENFRYVISAFQKESIQLSREEYISLAEALLKRDPFKIEVFRVPTDLSLQEYLSVAQMAVKENAFVIRLVLTTASTCENITPQDAEKISALVFQAVQSDWKTLQFIPTGVSGYDKLVKIAMDKSRGDALQFISPAFPGYEKICRDAIHKNPLSIQYVNPSAPFYQELHALSHERIKQNVFNAIEQNPDCILSLPHEGPYFIEYAVAAIHKKSTLLQALKEKVPESVFQRIESQYKLTKPQVTPEKNKIAEQAFSPKPQHNAVLSSTISAHDIQIQYNEIFPSIAQQSFKYPNFRELAIHAVMKNPDLVRHIRSQELHEEIKIACEVIQNPSKIQSLTPSQQQVIGFTIGLYDAQFVPKIQSFVRKETYTEIARQLIGQKTSVIAIDYFDSTSVDGYKDLAIQAVRENPLVLQFITPRKCRNDDEYKEIVRAAVGKDEPQNIIGYISTSMPDYEAFIEECTQQNPGQKRYKQGLL